MKFKIQFLISWFILVLVLNSIFYCQDNFDNLIKKGTVLSYTFNLDKAEMNFKEAVKISPENPEGYYGLAQIHLWSYIGTKQNDEFETFIKWFDLAAEKGENLFEQKPNDYKLAYLLGKIYRLKAMAEGTNKSYLKTYSATRTSRNYFEKALTINPEFYDAFRGLGEIHYFLDQIPGFFKFIVNLTGLEADKEKGFEEIKIAYKKGSVDKVDTAIDLAQIYSDYVAEYDSAETVLENLVHEYPTNPMINYQLAVVLIKNKKMIQAEKYLDTVLNLNQPAMKRTNIFSVFLKGDINYKLNDFKTAADYYIDFLNKNKEPDYCGIANYRLAICYKILGDDQLFKKYMGNASNGNQDLPDDEYAKRKSESILQNGISRDQIEIIKLKNLIDTGEYNSAYAALMQKVLSFKDSNVKAQGLMYLSEAAVNLNKNSEAIKYAEEADSLNPGEEKWIKPFSNYLIAKAFYNSGNMNKSKSYLKVAEDNNDYNYKVLLSSYINNLKRKY